MNDLVKFYDNKGGFTYKKPLAEIDPYAKMMKEHFYFGGSAVFGGEKINNHNTLAKLKDAQPQPVTR